MRFDQIRLLGEAAHWNCPRIARRGTGRGVWSSGLDITVAGFRARRLNTDHDDVVSRGGDLDSPGERGTVLVWLGDHVVRGKQSEDGLGIVTEQKKCRQANRGSSIT